MDPNKWYSKPTATVSSHSFPSLAHHSSCSNRFVPSSSPLHSSLHSLSLPSHPLPQGPQPQPQLTSLLQCLLLTTSLQRATRRIFFFFFFRAIPKAYGGSQARGLIGDTAVGLHHSHSHTGSEPCLPPTPQFTATLDP